MTVRKVTPHHGPRGNSVIPNFKPNACGGEAKVVGWRARSAFKLLDLDAKFGFLNGVKKAVDLCAAPGSWSQVLSSKLKGQPFTRCVAVDLQEIAPIPGVVMLQGDITSSATVDAISEALEGEKADIVVSDGAPDVTGVHALDENLQSQLLLASLSVALRVLRIGGTFIAKVFCGHQAPLLCSQLRVLFRRVSLEKPDSSRCGSIESFVICEGMLAQASNMKLQLSPRRKRWEDGLEPHVGYIVMGDLSSFDTA